MYIERQSEKCRNAIYTSNWPGSGDLRLMKDVLIIQTQRPIILRANGFFVVSMQMFEKVESWFVCVCVFVLITSYFHFSFR